MCLVLVVASSQERRALACEKACTVLRNASVEVTTIDDVRQPSASRRLETLRELLVEAAGNSHSAVIVCEPELAKRERRSDYFRCVSESKVKAACIGIGEPPQKMGVVPKKASKEAGLYSIPSFEEPFDMLLCLDDSCFS